MKKTMNKPSMPLRSWAGAVAFTVLALAGCAGTPPPGWQMNAKAAMDLSVQAWFEGNQRVEEGLAAQQDDSQLQLSARVLF